MISLPAYGIFRPPATPLTLPRPARTVTPTDKEVAMFRKILPLVLFFALFAACAAVLKAVEARTAYAQAPTPTEIKIPAGQKLKDADWHCYAGGSCELWVLTKPRKQGEAAETYVYANADGTRKYVIREQ